MAFVTTLGDGVRVLRRALAGIARTISDAGTTTLARIGGLAGGQHGSPEPTGADRRGGFPRALGGRSRGRRTREAFPLRRDEAPGMDPGAARDVEAAAGDTATGPLPESYGEDRILMLVRDPQTIFVCWDLSPRSVAQREEWIARRETDPVREVLEVHVRRRGGEAGGDAELRWRVPLLPRARSHYVTLPTGSLRVDVALGIENEAGGLRALLSTPATDLPPDLPDGAAGTPRWRALGRDGDAPRPPDPPSPEARDWILRRSATGSVSSSPGAVPGHHVLERDLGAPSSGR